MSTEAKCVTRAVHRALLLSPVMGLENRLGRHCVKVMDVPILSPEDHEGMVSSSLFTWKPANSVFVTLIKNTESKTVIYLHDSDMHYEASEAACLGPDCPVNTVLLGQVVLDEDNNNHSGEDARGYSIRLHLFDALQIGDDDFVNMTLPAEQRYNRLRMLCCDQPSGRHVITSPCTMLVQWAGPSYEIVRDFSMGPHARQNLPHHEAEAVICYGMQHPCKLFLIQK